MEISRFDSAIEPHRHAEFVAGTGAPRSFTSLRAVGRQATKSCGPIWRYAIRCLPSACFRATTAGAWSSWSFPSS